MRGRKAVGSTVGSVGVPKALLLFSFITPHARHADTGGPTVCALQRSRKLARPSDLSLLYVRLKPTSYDLSSIGDSLNKYKSKNIHAPESVTD